MQYLHNGVIEEMPADLEAAVKAEAQIPTTPPQPTQAQEIADLKQQNAEMRRMIETLEYNALGGI